MRASLQTTLRRLAATIVIVAGIAFSSIPFRSSTVPGATDPPQPPADNPWSDPMRDLLVLPCGSCHRASLDTAKPLALAVFDLEEKVWHRRMTDDQIRDLAKRAGSSKEIDEWDRPIVDRFVRCRLHGECAPTAPAP